MTVYLGVDLGTSALKVVALTAGGAVCGAARRGYPTARPEAGAAEQDPQDWWSALRDALDELAATVPPVSWAAMGLSAMLPTLVALDADGRPQPPAITWEDARAEPEADVLRAAVGDDVLYRITGQRVDGRYLAPMHARLARSGRGAATVAGAKDALFAELTGELLTDPSTAAGSGVFDLRTGEWNAELVATAGIPRLPTVAPTDTALPLRAEWRDRWGLPDGFPVVLGAADSVLGVLGLGARGAGAAAVIAGTSAIVLGIADTAVRDAHRRYLVTPLATPGWGLEMDVLAMGSAFSGIAALLGLAGPAALLATAEAVPMARAPLFLPYLTPGEQGALWDPALTGTLHGLRIGMEAGHVGRALLTGVVVELRRCLGVLETATGCRGPVLLGGGAAASPLLWRELADATGREVVVDPRVRDHSAIGAAMCAAAGLGIPIGVGSDRRRIDPDPDAAASWAVAAERHDTLRHTITGGSRR